MKNILMVFVLILGVLVLACDNPFFPGRHKPKVEDEPQRQPTGGGWPGWGNSGGGSGNGSATEPNFATVKFNTDGGTPQPQEILVAWDYVIGRLRPITRGTDGFGGWFDENGNPWDVEARPVKQSDDVNRDGKITLTSKWVANNNSSPSPIVYEVIFYPYPSGETAANPVTIPSQYIVQDAKIIQPVNPPQLTDGRGFFGWYTDPGLTALWNFDTGVTGNLTLYARYEAGIRTVIFETNGGTRPDGNTQLTRTQTVPIGGYVQDPGPLVKTGYSLGGWYTDFNFATTNQWNFATDTVKATDPDPLILYVRWVPSTRTVIFSVNGGPDMPQSMWTIPFGGRLYYPGPPPARSGHVFTGWYENPDCNGSPWISSNPSYKIINTVDEIIGMDPMYFYAGWSTSPCSVTFNGSGEIPNKTQDLRYGERAIVPYTPPPANNSLALGGWYTKDGSGNDWGVIWDFNTEVTSHVVLFARWVTRQYTVTFDLGMAPPASYPPPSADPNLLAPQHVPSGGKAIEPFMPPLPATNKSFYCWSESTSGYTVDTVTKFDFNTPITADKTLYARWVPPEPDMVWVPRGSFIMGDSGVSGSPAAYHAYPTRRVTVDGFYISRYQITQIKSPDTNRGYDVVMGFNPSQFSRNTFRPVERVSWFDAIQYCIKLTDLEMAAGLTQVYTLPVEPQALYPALSGSGGAITIINTTVNVNWDANGFRLPTEAEWEYAARGGNNSPGNYIYAGSNDASAVAWFNTTVQAQASGNQATQIVGSKQPNPLGIYDMSGNVSEWVWDKFEPYKDIVSANPGVTNYINPGRSGNVANYYAAGERVRRGGGWSNAVGNVRSVVRSSDTPDTANWVIGFRVVRGPSTIQ